MALLALMHGIIANVKACLRSSGIPQPVTAVYLDDRTFVTRSARVALQVCHARRSVSKKMRPRPSCFAKVLREAGKPLKKVLPGFLVIRQGSWG